MEKRVAVKIGGRDYTLLSGEGEEYMQDLVALVNLKVREYEKNSALSDIDAAYLAALAIADDYRKCQAALQNARDQIQSLLDDARRARAETAEVKRELGRLRQG